MAEGWQYRYYSNAPPHPRLSAFGPKRTKVDFGPRRVVRFWHIATFRCAAKFVAYWTNNGQRAVLGLNGSVANDPNRSSTAFDPDLSPECAFAGASLAVGSALWRRVGLTPAAVVRVARAIV